MSNQHEQLDALWLRDAPAFAASSDRIARSALVGDGEAIEAAQARMAGVIGRTRALAAMIAADNGLRDIDAAARARVRASVHAGGGGAGAARRVNLPVDASRPPTFWAAVRSILRRRPVLARTADAVIAAHEADGIAFARSAVLSLTRKVQELLARAVEIGASRPSTVAMMRQITPWTRAYSETVYRTNLSGAYADGLHRMATMPEVGDAVAGYEWSAVGDRDTRPNHAAADGVIGSLEDPFWAWMGPPAGYNCRCARRLVLWTEARRRGLRELHPIKRPPGAFPDPGFRR